MQSYSIVPILRRLDPGTLRHILDAIRTGSRVHVRYQSMTRPEPTWRWLSPHALGFDGFRWHARTWCHTREEFRDFVLARIMEIDEAAPSDINPDDDLGWQREVTLRLVPHPDLQDGNRRAFELDFGMADGAVEVTTRACLAYYFMRQLGLDHDPAKVDPKRQQVVLANRDEVEEARKTTGVGAPTEDDD